MLHAQASDGLPVDMDAMWNCPQFPELVQQTIGLRESHNHELLPTRRGRSSLIALSGIPLQHHCERSAKPRSRTRSRRCMITRHTSPQTSTSMRISQGLSVAALVAAMIGCSNVVKEPRGERSYRTFKRIEGAVGIGVSKLTYDALLQDAATELLIFRDLGEGTADSASLARYSAALDKYRDAGKLWSEQIDNARYDWMPKGAIYLTDHSIAVKYKLPTTSRKMPYTGTSYETIDSESIQSIWALAKTDVDSADARLLPDIRKAH